MPTRKNFPERKLKRQEEATARQKRFEENLERAKQKQEEKTDERSNVVVD